MYGILHGISSSYLTLSTNVKISRISHLLRNFLDTEMIAVSQAINPANEIPYAVVNALLR